LRARLWRTRKRGGFGQCVEKVHERKTGSNWSSVTEVDSPEGERRDTRSVRGFNERRVKRGARKGENPGVSAARNKAARRWKKQNVKVVRNGEGGRCQEVELLGITGFQC